MTFRGTARQIAKQVMGGFAVTRSQRIAARRGAMGILFVLALPALIYLGALGVDTTYVNAQYLMLRQTSHASALAAGRTLANYYSSSGSSTSIVSAAQTIATANMPSGTYGTVLQTSGVSLGNWDTSTKAFTSLATSNGTTPNAVKITALRTSANGNALSLLFGASYGKSSIDMSVSAIAMYGTRQTYNWVILNDLSQSFSSKIVNQRDANTAILNCLSTSTGSSSQLGITGFTGHSSVFQALTTASTNQTTLQTKINTLASCGNNGVPSCAGSNVAAGIYSAIQQFSGAAYASTVNNIIIITDGVPNAMPITYAQADGIYPTPSSATPTCTSSCSSANLWTMALNQASVANTNKINISTIYYSGNTPANSQTTYANQLAQLVKGSGIALVAPSAASISSVYAGICSAGSAKLVSAQ